MDWDRIAQAQIDAEIEDARHAFYLGDDAVEPDDSIEGWYDKADWINMEERG
jgi:hypothetical protein